MAAHAWHPGGKLGLPRVRVSSVNSVPGSGGRRRQPRWPQASLNPGAFWLHAVKVRLA